MTCRQPLAGLNLYKHLNIMTKGQQNLIEDLEKLLKETKMGKFVDFTNHKYPAPKKTLASKLFKLRDNVIYGRYDD